jgi:hypothetical protein
LPTDLPLITDNKNIDYQHLNPSRSIAEIVGDEEEKKVLEFLTNNKKNKFEKLIKN